MPSWTVYEDPMHRGAVSPQIAQALLPQKANCRSQDPPSKLDETSNVRRVHGLLGTVVRRIAHSCALLVLLAGPAHAQSTLACTKDSLRQLTNAIEMHNDHAYRLNAKFKDIWYPQGPIPAEVRSAIGLKGIKKYLAALGGRKTAVLLHGVDQDDYGPTWYLRTWLITYRGKIICAAPRKLKKEDWGTFQASGWSSLGVRGAKQPRGVAQVDNGERGTKDQAQRWGAILQRLSDMLVPYEVVEEFEASKIDTLVVVPITVRWVTLKGQDEGEGDTFDRFDSNNEEVSPSGEGSRTDISHPSTRAALSIGVLPFAALPVGGDALIKKMSVIMAPGFFSFTQNPEAVREKYLNPIVIGNPEGQGYPALPGAGEEAKHVATLLKTDRLFIEKRANKATLEKYLRQNPDSVDFIYLATHGLADANNPVDKSFLVFSDGQWNAREISHLRRQVQVVKDGKLVNQDLPLLQAKPLVVMSACQTALGKDFPSGTIGLARAWQWAGASNVVMSLWSVDDEATKELMEQFVDFVMKGQAVDKALQSAMLNFRGKYPSPSNWASFSVYGAPERLGPISSSSQ